MTNSGAEELLRARTLGFFTPRPGRRQAPRQAQENVFDVDTIAPTLDSLGIPLESVINVTKCVSRRLVLMVELADGTARLLKWPDADTELDNDYEYVMLSMFEELDVPRRTREALPRILAGGPETRVIAVDVVKNCDSLRDLIKQSPVVDARHLVHLAAVLAGLHQTPVEDAYKKYPEWLLRPPVPKTTVLTPYEYAHGCGLDFDAYLRTMQELESYFLELHSQWRPDSLVHFDLRDDNILLPRDQAAGSPVRIIDWELAGFGDPYYDIGYLIGQFLTETVRSYGDEDTSRAAHRNIRTFISAYRKLGELDTDSEKRIVQYAGITLLLQATMRLQQLGALNRIGHLCLLYGKRLLKDPCPEAILR